MCLLIYARYTGFSLFCFFFFKQKTAYEMRISDWSSDVCSSDLNEAVLAQAGNYNVSVIDQAGSDHVANVAQYSNGNVSGVYQTGVANSATVVQGSAPVAN